MTNLEVMMALRKIGIGDIEELINSKISPKEALVVDLIYNKQCLGNGFYFTHSNKLDIIVDTNTGNVYRYSNNKYHSIVYNDELQVEEIKTGNIYEIIQNGVLCLDGLEVANGHTSEGTNSYYAVQFRIPYDIKIKFHVIVCAMIYGYDVIEAMGMERSKDIHHKTNWRLTHDNSSKNLELLTIAEHRAKRRKKCRLSEEISNS